MRSSNDSTGYALREVGWLKNGISTLAPGTKLATLFDNVRERPSDWEGRYEATVSYVDRFGKTHTDDFTIDWDGRAGSLYIDRKTIHDVAVEFERMRKTIENAARGWPRPVPVKVELPDDDEPDTE